MLTDGTPKRLALYVVVTIRKAHSHVSVTFGCMCLRAPAHDAWLKRCAIPNSTAPYSEDPRFNISSCSGFVYSTSACPKFRKTRSTVLRANSSTELSRVRGTVAASPLIYTRHRLSSEFNTLC